MPKPTEVISHWHHTAEDFNTSSLGFFQAVEEQLAVKEAPIRPERIEYRESGLLSDKREYLRVSYGRYSFDLGAMPFGKDFLFSWWLVRRLPSGSLMLGCGMVLALPIALFIFVASAGLIKGTLTFLVVLTGFVFWVISARNDDDLIEDAILGLPVLGPLYLKYVKPVTYYSEDSRVIFEEAVHAVVLQNVEAVLAAKGAQALAPAQRKPQSRPLIS